MIKTKEEIEKQILLSISESTCSTKFITDALVLLEENYFSNDNKWFYKFLVTNIEKNGFEGNAVILDRLVKKYPSKTVQLIAYINDPDILPNQGNLEYWSFILIQEYIIEQFEEIIKECNDNSIQIQLVGLNDKVKDCFDKVLIASEWTSKEYQGDKTTEQLKLLRTKINTITKKVKINR